MELGMTPNKYEILSNQKLAVALQSFGYQFDLTKIGKKVQVPAKSGQLWRLDGLAIKNSRSVIIECKLWQNNIPPEVVGGIVFRMQDIDCEEALLVTTSKLSPGAKMIAGMHNVKEVRMSINQSDNSYKYNFSIFDHAPNSQQVRDVLRKHGVDSVEYKNAILNLGNTGNTVFVGLSDELKTSDSIFLE